jgi:hypothetical protein
MRGVLHAHVGADLEGLVNPFQNALARHFQGSCDLAHSLAGMIAPQDLRPLDIAESGSLGLAKLIETTFLFGCENERRTCGYSCHGVSIARNKTIWICFNETLY